MSPLNTSLGSRLVRGDSWPIARLPGISPQDLKCLVDSGVDTTFVLLELGHPAAQQLGLPQRLVDKWLVLADLARVPGVGCEYCGLLLHAGIISIAQLSQASPQRLQAQILRLQVAALKRRDLCPSVAAVREWVQAANRLLGG